MAGHCASRQSRGHERDLGMGAMTLETAAFLMLAAQCSPGVAPDTLLAIAAHESELHVFLVHDNTAADRFELETSFEAIEKSRALMAQGHSLDLGLMQVNSRNLAGLGISLQDVFEPCTNIASGGRVLENAYRQALARGLSAAAALKAALSSYNTGDEQAGVANGYVQNVERRATPYVVPSLGSIVAGPLTVAGIGQPAVAPIAVAERSVHGSAKSSDVFARPKRTVFSQEE